MREREIWAESILHTSVRPGPNAGSGAGLKKRQSICNASSKHCNSFSQYVMLGCNEVTARRTGVGL